MVVGSGAREHAMASRLKSEGYSVISFQIRSNLGLERVCAKNIIAPLYEARSIVAVAMEHGVSAIIPGQEQAIFAGLTNRAEEESIFCFAPSLEASRLESDKTFAKEIVSQVNPQLIIPYFVANNIAEATGFISDNGFPVVLKTRHGTDQNRMRIIREADQSNVEPILTSYFNDSQQLILEKFVDGQDFYVYCMTDGNNIFFPKMIRDYPFKLEGDLGEKTGGMGSASNPGPLPYVSESEYNLAKECVLSTIHHLRADRGVIYKGILVGQFIKSSDGIYFLEFDVKPGDPEIINLLFSLRSDFGSLIMDSKKGRMQSPGMNSNSVVSIYHVPYGYPGQDVPFRVHLDEDTLGSESIFYNDLQRVADQYVTGLSRTLVVTGVADNLENARRKALVLSDGLKTGLFYRRDIGNFKFKNLAKTG